jgi:predicted DNA-binding transcriptional regulator AlpA
MTSTNETTRPTIPEAYLREVEGRILAHRGALEELTGLSKKSVDRLAGQPDFPKPVVARGPQRRAWYDPDDLVDVALAHQPQQVGVDAEAAAGPGNELLTPSQVAELMQLKNVDSVYKYVEQSEAAWRRGEHGYLPMPDEETPRGTKQIARRWKRSTIIAHQERRPGHGGRPPTPSPNSELTS